MDMTEALCRYGPVPAELHEALVGRWPTLCSRRDLSREAWFATLATKTSTDTAAQLLKRDLDDEQLRAFVAKERRQGTLEILCELHWDALDDELRAAVGGRARGKLAAWVADRVDGELRRQCLAATDGNRRIAWLAAAPPERCDDGELAWHLDTVAEWLADTGSTGARARGRAIEVLAHARPTSLPTLVHKLPSFAYAAVAGALSLWEPELQDAACARIVGEDMPYAAMALAANPVCSKENRDRLAAWAASNGNAEVAQLLGRDLPRTDGDPRRCGDAQTVRQLVRRASPSEYRPAGRPGQLAYLAHADECSDGLTWLVKGLGEVDLPDWVFADAVVTLADRFCGDEDQPRAVRDDLVVARRNVAEGTAFRAWSPPEVAGVTCEPDAWRTVEMASFFNARPGDPWSEARHRARLAGMADDMGTGREQWEVLLTMAETFQGRLGELVDVVRATVA